MFALVPLVLLAAVPGQSLSLDDVLKDVSAHAPTVRTQRAAVKVAEARVDRAGSWEDPIVSLMVEDVPLGAQMDDAPMPMLTWRVAQELNVFGRRRLQKEAARARRNAEATLSRRAAYDAQAEAVSAFYELWMARQMRELIDRQIAVLRRMRASAATRYAAGLMMGHHDVLRSDAELASMRAERTALEAEERAMAAMLNVLRGVAIEAVPGELALPARRALPGRDSLLRAARDRPELELMRQMVVEMEAERDLALRMYLPMPMVGLFYQQRPGAPRDSFGGELMVNVPLWWFDRQRSEVAMADAMVNRARLQLDAMELMTRTELEAAWSRAMALDQTLEALERTALPRMKETVASAEAAYMAGTGDYLRLLEAVMAQQRLEATLLRTIVRRELAVFELVRVVGAPLPDPHDEAAR